MSLIRRGLIAKLKRIEIQMYELYWGGIHYQNFRVYFFCFSCPLWQLEMNLLLKCLKKKKTARSMRVVRVFFISH